MLSRQPAQPLEKTASGRDHAHVPDYRLDHDGGDFTAVQIQSLLYGVEIVVWN